MFIRNVNTNLLACRFCIPRKPNTFSPISFWVWEDHWLNWDRCDPHVHPCASPHQPSGQELLTRVCVLGTSPPKNNHQIFYYPHTIVFSFIRMCILAINLFRAFVCAMFKVFITSVSPCKMRANLTPFRSVATCPLRLSKFKPTEMKNSGSHLHSPHLRCSRSSRG